MKRVFPIIYAGCRNVPLCRAGLLFLAILMPASSALASNQELLTVNAAVTNTPVPHAAFSWDLQLPGAVIQIQRRELGAVAYCDEVTYECSGFFETIGTVNYPETAYTDTALTPGKAYEYRIARPSFTDAASGLYYPETAAYTVATIDAPLEDSRGTVLLAVDNSLLPEFDRELALLELDLAGDGWKVSRINSDPAGTGTHQNLKAAIVSACNADPDIHALYLFGALPAARSGLFAPDGHSPSRAHETDLYYADLDGGWTDSTLNTDADKDGGKDAEEDNIPGDGKFDQAYIASAIELMTGRVDFKGMVSYRKNEREYLRDYIQKSHAWRYADRPVPYRGLINDSNYLFMEHNWLVPMFGSANVTEAAFQPVLNTNAYLWAAAFPYYNGASEADYSAVHNQAMFTLCFGSYKQMWYRQDNAMRALLAQPDWGLASAWGARPAWHMHHMAAGKPVGYSALRTANNLVNYSEYNPPGEYLYMDGYVSVNLMGDPTLRLHPVAPPAGLTASGSGAAAALVWRAPADPSRTGFHVYRSAERLGSYTRLTEAPLPAGATNYTDSAKPDGAVYYQVRAVALTSVPTGTYSNQSEGAFTVVHADGSGNAVPVALEPAPVPAQTGIPAPVGFPGSDEDGDALTPVVILNPSNGLLRWNSGKAAYVSAAGFTGDDRFTYRLFDGISLSDPVTATVNVTSAKSDVLLAWTFSTNIPAGSYQNATSTWQHASMTSSVITKGSAVFLSSGSLNNGGYYISSATGAALDTNDYLGWTVSPKAGYRASLSRISFFAFANLSTSVTSPPDAYNLELRISTNNFSTYQTAALDQPSSTAGISTLQNGGRFYSADLAGISELQNRTNAAAFRLYFWNTDKCGLGKSGDNSVQSAADLVISGLATDASLGTAPGIAIASGTVPVTPGGTVPVGNTLAGTSSMVTFRISSTGTENLTVGTASISGQTNVSASVRVQPDSLLAPGTETPLAVSLTPAAAGNWSCIVTLPNSVSNENPAVWILSGTAQSSFGYNVWSNSIAWNGADSSPEADPNADGWPNLLAYAMDIDPVNTPVKSQLPVLEVSGGFFTLTVRERIGTDADLSLESVADLVNGNWADCVVIREVIDPDADGDGTARLVKYKVAVEPRQYLRLRARTVQ